MTPQNKRIVGLFSRYVVIILLGLGNLWLFYRVLTPVTLHVVAFVLSLSREILVVGNNIHLEYYTLAIVPACVAGSAFYLLTVLVFSTSNLSVKKRSLVLLCAILSLFVLNIVRILFLVSLVGTPWFSLLHWFIWNILSTVFVVGIWFGLVKLFSIDTIPVYSDVRFMRGLVKDSKNS